MPTTFSLPPLLVALAAMLWGNDLLLRPGALSAGWSPAWVVLGEHLLLIVVFAPVLWRGRRALARLSRRQWTALAFVAWGGSALATWLYTLAFQMDLSRALTVSLLQKSQPLFAILLAGRVLGERRTPLFWAWCALALAGAYLLTGFRRPPSLTDIHAQQALCALGAAALWGAATVAGRGLSKTLPPALLTGARFAVAIPALVALTLVPVSHPLPATHTVPYAFVYLLLIVLLPDLAGMGLYYVGLRGTPASVATLAELCYPLTALLIGVGIQHTRITPAEGVGLGLLVVAVLMLSRRPGVAAAPESAHALQSAALP